MSDCSEESCQIQIGKLISASKIIVGSIGNIGARYLLNMKMIEVSTGETIKTESEKYNSIEALVDDSERLAFSFLDDSEEIKKQDIEVAYIILEKYKEGSALYIDNVDSTNLITDSKVMSLFSLLTPL